MFGETILPLATMRFGLPYATTDLEWCADNADLGFQIEGIGRRALVLRPETRASWQNILPSSTAHERITARSLS